MTESRKEWSKPELIVLGRSKPEEAVLVACKGALSPDGPGFQFVSGCGLAQDFCPDCSAYQAS
jgi:hypothetical protein